MLYEMKIHNKSLAEAAKNAGIEDSRDYAIFQNRGYQGLYGGLGAKDLHEKRGLKKSQQILDYMGSTEFEMLPQKVFPRHQGVGAS